MIRPITKIGNPVLRRRARSVPRKDLPKLGPILRDMVRTMRAAEGVGIAANQVGQGRSLFVMECAGNKRYPRAASFPLQAYLNPRILRYSRAKVQGWEGCLSIPGFRGKVRRARSVVLEAWTPDGRKVRKLFRGFEARVVQHEVDHLNGYFYMDRMGGLRSWTHLEEFNKRPPRSTKDK